ncbi:hypothetical protein [Parabacteroides sp.]|uniref:hypothetical protein n=1 Tax=Parabacteroides sp. TaxID=1869337 RepID=UPI00308007E4
MKGHLLQKWTTICRFAIFFLFVSSLAKGEIGSTYYIHDYYHESDEKKIATVEVTQTTEVPLQTYLTFTIRRGFQIKQLYLNNTLLGTIESGMKNGDYITYKKVIDSSNYNSYTNNGTEVNFKAEYTFSDIENLDDLKSIFNYYVPNSTIQSPNDINTLEVNQIVTGPGSGSSVNPWKLNLTPSSGPFIIHQMNANSRISNFDISLNGGNLTFKVEERTGYFLPNIELNSGSLTLVGENATLSSLIMKNGSLSLKDGATINNLTANRGNITITNNKRKDYSFKELYIEGDVTIIGDCIIKNESSYRKGDFLAEKTTIKGGIVTMKQLRLSPNYPLIVKEGNVTFEQVVCAQNFNMHSSDFTKITAAIQQKGGNILLKDCYLNNIVNEEYNADYFIEVNAGSLIIDGGLYMKSGELGLLRIIGDAAHVEIKDGKFYTNNNNGNNNYSVIYQEKGRVDISGGLYYTPVCIEGGTLNISKAHFPVVNTTWNNIDANLHILGSQAKVSLSGGYYSYQTVYIAPSLSITPESLLVDGCGFYTWNQDIQPDVEIIDPKMTNSNNGVSFLTFGQVKRKDATPSSNDFLEAAKTADVGVTGTDVKAIKIDEASTSFSTYDLEINTDQGLAWLATKVHHEEYGISNGKEYKRINTIRLTADLDMSAYNWIPFQFSCRKFDGQGHRVSGLKVNQSEAAFMSYNSDTLANLVVSGQFNSISTLYTNTAQYAAGLVRYNTGTIINCGVQQSTVSCTTTDNLDAWIGGLVAINHGSIQNCYMTGNVTCNSTPINNILSPDNRYKNHIIGGIVGENWNSVLNSYHTDGIVNISPSTTANLNVTKDDIAVKKTDASQIDCTTTPSLENLNQNVETHNTAVETGGISWSNWVITEGINNKFPVHEYKEDTDNPSYIKAKFTLLVQGNGEFKGRYYVSKESAESESATEERTFVADTTITVINGKSFNLTATPGKGASLNKIVQIRNTNEIALDNIKEGEPFTYNVVATDTLKAYFRTDTLYVENDTTVIGNTEEITEVKQISISDAGTEDKPAVIELGNVTVKSDEDPNKEATTTINKDSHVILQLSGNNSLGKLINKGNTILKFAENQAKTPNLSVTDVVNKGVLIDETGLIKMVQDENGDLQLSVNEETDKEVKEGSSTALTAEAQVSDIYNVIFLWQRWNGTSWADIQTTTETSQQSLVRTKSELRTSSTIKLTNTLPVTLNTANTYQYRCLITNSKADVSTTLTVKAEVRVTSTSGNPDPEPTPIFYKVTLPSVAGVKTVPSAGTYSIEAGDFFTFNLTLEEAYNESQPIITVGNQEIIPTKNGNYKIQTVTEDVSIVITGIALNIPTSNIVTKEEIIKVWGNKNTLHILTPQRTKVFIYTFGGQLYKTQTVSGEYSFSGIPSGNYLIYIDNKIFKIAL